MHKRALLILLICLTALGLTGCGGEDEATVDDPLALLVTAADQIRSADSFRLYVIQEGAPYTFPIAVAADLMNVRFRLAQGQYVAPDTLQARASVVAGLTLEIDIFAQGDDQWFRVNTLAIPWQNAPFAAGFNPAALISDDGGFQAALTALLELEFVGATTLEDGQSVYHLRGIADGPSVATLVVGLLEIEGEVPVDVFINRETGYPARLVLTQPETATEENPEPTRWVIDVFDINAEPQLDPPPFGGEGS